MCGKRRSRTCRSMEQSSVEPGRRMPLARPLTPPPPPPPSSPPPRPCLCQRQLGRITASNGVRLRAGPPPASPAPPKRARCRGRCAVLGDADRGGRRGVQGAEHQHGGDQCRRRGRIARTTSSTASSTTPPPAMSMRREHRRRRRRRRQLRGRRASDSAARKVQDAARGRAIRGKADRELRENG